MKKLLPLIIVTILTVAVGYTFLNLTPLRNLDNLIADALIRYIAPTTKISDKIAIVFLDEETMKDLPYRSPVPRNFLQRLNEKILAAKPKVVGYDIFFKDPTTTTDDQQLATSFKNGPVFAVSAGRTDENGKGYEDEPMDLFKNSLKGTGLADLPFSSSDSTVRFAQFEFDFRGKVRPSFVAELYNAATGGDAEALIHDPKNSLRILPIIPPFPTYTCVSGVAGFRLREFSPRLERGYSTNTRIRFAGPPSKIGKNNLFKIFPANLVVKGLIPNNWLENKIVMVGAAYEDGTDAYITPYYSSRYNYKRMPGVEIHANILNSLLTKQFYYELPLNIILLGLVVLGFVSSLFFLYGPMWRGIAALITLTILTIAKIIFYFHWHGLVIPFVPFEGSMLVTFGACLGWRSVTEGKQKRFIKNVFAKYVPPSVVDRMIANPKLLTLGGEQCEITCIFTDIASFTSISEKLDPKTLVSFLNEYLDKLTRIIFKHGGTLDKYEGDAIIAFFGAPLNLQDHKKSACLAALEMQKASTEISKKWKDVCGMEITTRIGINSGQAVVGNMGSDLRFDYTAIGDTINLASRLEGANKFFGTKILASESVIASLPRSAGRAKQFPGTSGVQEIASPPSSARNNMAGDIIFRPVARIKVKGKAESVAVYEVIGLESEIGSAESEKIKSQLFPKEIVELTSK